MEVTDCAFIPQADRAKLSSSFHVPPTPYERPEQSKSQLRQGPRGRKSFRTPIRTDSTGRKGLAAARPHLVLDDLLACRRFPTPLCLASPACLTLFRPDHTRPYHPYHPRAWLATLSARSTFTLVRCAVPPPPPTANFPILPSHWAHPPPCCIRAC